MLYFGLCPYGTICDVFINTLAGWSDVWLQPCTPDILKNGTLKHRVHEDYVLKFSHGNPLKFRNINWIKRLYELDNFLKDQTKKVWIGNFDPNQLNIVKDFFEDNVKTVAIQYEEDQRNLILEDAENLYRAHFNKEPDVFSKKMIEQLIPKSLTPPADYVINISDFYNADKFISFIQSIDGPRNKAQLDYYYSWLNKNENN